MKTFIFISLFLLLSTASNAQISKVDPVPVLQNSSSAIISNSSAIEKNKPQLSNSNAITPPPDSKKQSINNKSEAKDMNNISNKDSKPKK